MKPRKIIVHDGPAHLDDVLAVALALGYFGRLPVERREPSGEELSDPEVLVLDVGGRHQPELGNFDHHQQKPESPEQARAAFALLAESLGLDEMLAGNPWYRAVNINDCLGPLQAARVLGLERLPKELVNPLGVALVELFAAGPEQVVLDVLERIGRKMIDESRRAAWFLPELRDRLRVVEVGGVKGVLLSGPALEDGWQVRLLEEEMERLGEQVGEKVAFSVVADQKGEGWAVYRRDDHPALDFSVLGGDPRVLFAHPAGFMVKTRELIPEGELLELIGKGVTKGRLSV